MNSTQKSETSEIKYGTIIVDENNFWSETL